MASLVPLNADGQKRSPLAGELKTRFPVAVILLLTLVACGKEGPPLPPEIRIAERTSDLKAYQEGEVAELRWSYPSMTTAGQTLTDIEAIEVWRATLPKGQEPPPPITPQDRALQRQLLEAQGEIVPIRGTTSNALPSMPPAGSSRGP